MFSWFKNRRRRRLLAEPFSRDWLGILSRNVPYYAWLPAAKQEQLRDDLRIFIAERQWFGCAGLEITDEMRVTIAAQACLLVLCIQPTYHYDRIQSLLIHPGPYQRRAPRWSQFIEGQVTLLGEAYHRSPIVLSWQSVLDGISNPHDGDNVVFHEFAHHLDGLDGDVDGTPPLEGREQYRLWDEITTAEYQRLVRAVREGSPSFLRAYGATNRAEFFAVASENFFERGPAMRRELPELYGVLRDFYQQDTDKWPEGTPRVRHSASHNRSHHHVDDHRADSFENEETRSLLRLIELKPGSADAYFSLGVAYLNEGRDEQAETALSEAVRLNPTDEESLLQRGIARVRSGRADAAKADFDAALELDPSDVDAYRARAQARLQLRDDVGALEDCAKVLRQSRGDATALHVRGLALSRTGNYSKAIRSLSSAISADPNRAEFYADRSRLYEIIGSRARAERDRVDAIRRDPSMAESLRKGIKMP